MDRDHVIKCIHTSAIRTNRHDGIVNAIKKLLNKSRKASSKQLENLLKPDIVMEVNNVKYVIDVTFSVEDVQYSKYLGKKRKYKGDPFTEDTVIPVVVQYNGIISQHSVEDLKIVPEVDIKKLYEAVYYHIALAQVKAEDLTGKLIRKLLD